MPFSSSLMNTLFSTDTTSPLDTLPMGPRLLVVAVVHFQLGTLSISGYNRLVNNTLHKDIAITVDGTLVVMLLFHIRTRR